MTNATHTINYKRSGGGIIATATNRAHGEQNTTKFMGCKIPMDHFPKKIDEATMLFTAAVSGNLVKSTPQTLFKNHFGPFITNESNFVLTKPNCSDDNIRTLALQFELLNTTPGPDVPVLFEEFEQATIVAIAMTDVNGFNSSSRLIKIDFKEKDGVYSSIKIKHNKLVLLTVAA